ncbi:LamG-like jellyroll fold domain-containing protein [Streptomyces sp. NPDC058067]|uniref:LamG-like jellyroll fold domain-containing protein n=1 Tax=Streptomyces sp. NPDC058067 TaxID=3346324 RepID=UPI0036F053EC
MPLLVEMGWGGLVQNTSSITWTDITQRVDTVQGVVVTRGASDELSETQPGTATLVLDNADGALTPGNPNSPYYPFVRRNAPIRVSVAVMPSKSGASPYPLSQLGDAFDDGVPDSSLWTTAGGAAEPDGRMRLPATPGVTSRYTSIREWKLAGSSLAAKFATAPAAGSSSSASVSMYIYSATSGTRLRWFYNALTNELRALNEVGSTDGSPTVLAYNPIQHAWLRIRESGGTVYFETSGDGFGWTVRRALATPAWVGTDTVQVEFAAFRSGGTADYAEFDLVGASIRPRFYGMVNEWPVEWEGLYSKVQISCTDLFKRLNRLPALKSVLGEEILAQDVSGIFDFLSAYYPLSEPAGSLAAGDLSGKGCGALALTQAGTGGLIEFGSEGLPATGETAVTFTPSTATAGQYLAADLGAAFETDDTTYMTMVSCWFKTTTASRAILGLYSANLDDQLILGISSGGSLTVETTNDGTPPLVLSIAGTLTDGNWHHIYFDNASKRIYVDGVQIGATLPAVTVSALRFLHVGGYRGARLFSGQIGHVVVSHATGPIGATLAPLQYTAGTTAFEGETADARITRLARYAGLSSVSIWGTTHDAVAGQGPGGTGVVARMREIEATESARLWAERDWYGLAYQSRDVRYNPSPSSETFTIDYADLEPGISLADDDQKMVNQVDASRPGGATQRVSAPASVLAFGEYPQDLNLLKTNDNSVLDAAAWLVSRYANPQPELREVPIEAYTMASYLDILDAEIGSYFSVYNLPAQAQAAFMRVTVEGYTESIKHNSHLITFHTSASSTDSVWVLDDPDYSQLDQTTRLAY